jgi:alpha,alpha-trehalase
MMNGEATGRTQNRIDPDGYDAAVLDMDGVVTRSARAHAAAWKRMFDEYLEKRSEEEGRDYEPFDAEDEYYRLVDGKPRYEGVRRFLEARGVSLPHGDPDDPPGRETVCGLGNLKNEYFLEHLKENGAEAYSSTVEFVHWLRERKVGVAVISSSKNAKAVLEAAGVLDLFPVIIDGVYAVRHELEGKPEPDVFLAAAQKLGADPGRTLIVEDAVAGVQAGRAGGFKLVIGVDRSGRNAELERSGADFIVSDLSEIRSEHG